MKSDHGLLSFIIAVCFADNLQTTKPGACITIRHSILSPFALSVVAIIIPAINAMKPKPGMPLLPGHARNGMKKLFSAAFAGPNSLLHNT